MVNAAVITGWGMKVPALRLSNEKVVERILANGGKEDTNTEWIKERTHIEYRYIADPQKGETTAFLAAQAAQEALACAHLEIDDIHEIWVATVTPDRRGVPSTASTVHKLLGATRRASAYDLNAGCSSFVSALKFARYSAIMEQHNILVIGAERLSTIIDWRDRNIAPLLGDGAGACVIQPRYIEIEEKKKSGIKYVMTSGMGNVTPLHISDKTEYLKMDGKAVFQFATTESIAMLMRIIDKQAIDPSDIDWIIPHQANGRITKHIQQALHKQLLLYAPDTPALKMKIFENITRYGNTSSASIPICIAEMANNNLLLPGQRVLLIAFGAGLTSAVADIVWGT